MRTGTDSGPGGNGRAAPRPAPARARRRARFPGAAQDDRTRRRPRVCSAPVGERDRSRSYPGSAIWSDGPADSTRVTCHRARYRGARCPDRRSTNTPRLPPVDAPTLRRLLLHEAQVHATPGRDLRDLGDAILLHDPTDREPFWNRLEAVRWPVRADAFDRRLTEALVLFATLGRQPHIWASPLYDRPADLVARLHANGFSDMGPGNVMALADPAPSRAVVEAARGGRRSPSNGIGTRPAARLGRPRALIVSVLVDAFDVEPERVASLEAETVTSLANPVVHALRRPR